MQMIIRIFINNRNKCKIGSDNKISKANYRFKANYLIETTTLEKTYL